MTDINSDRDPTAPKTSASQTSNEATQPSLIRRVTRRLVLMSAIAFGGLFLLSFSGRVPTNIGHIDGQLAVCPDSPNCVSTQTDQTDKLMPPIVFDGTAEEAIERLKATIAEKFPRAKLICENKNYLHYEFVSLIFRFVDDVEFLVNDDTNQIDFRSASRVGHSDLGANRKRMETISTEMK
jgi:uncharacterized protein (DUF1499 family)